MSTDKDKETLRDVLRRAAGDRQEKPDPQEFSDALDACDTPTELWALLDRVSLFYFQTNICNACQNGIGPEELYGLLDAGHCDSCSYVTAWLRVHLNEREFLWRTVSRRARALGADRP